MEENRVSDTVDIARDYIEDILDDIWKVIDIPDDQNKVGDINIWQSKKAIELNQVIQKALHQSHAIGYREGVEDILNKIRNRKECWSSAFVHSEVMKVLDEIEKELNYGKA